MGNTKRKAKLRAVAAKRQGYRCYYCGVPMAGTELPNLHWEFGVPAKYSNRLICTAEHLVPKSVGGKITSENIVAACQYCNGNRRSKGGNISYQKYKEFVKREVTAGRWYWKPRGDLDNPRMTRQSKETSNLVFGLIFWGVLLLSLRRTLQVKRW